MIFYDGVKLGARSNLNQMVRIICTEKHTNGWKRVRELKNETKCVSRFDFPQQMKCDDQFSGRET